MSKYEITIKINTNANSEREAENKAWEFLCKCSREDIHFEVMKYAS